VSGDRHWLVAAVGGQEGVQALLRQMRESTFKDAQLVLAVHRELGVTQVLTLDKAV
jgi:hypothetical protein